MTLRARILHAHAVQYPVRLDDSLLNILFCDYSNGLVLIYIDYSPDVLARLKQGPSFASEDNLLKLGNFKIRVVGL